MTVSATTSGVDKLKIQDAVRSILEALGEDPDREGLLDTPRRVADYFEEISSGLCLDPSRHLQTVFHEEHEGIVIVKDIPFHSICEHHLVPFVGEAHIAYLPREGNVVGLSKLARLVEDYARRPQLQERLTGQIADAMAKKLRPLGIMIIVEAEHMCMTIRGVKKPGAKTVTSAVRGVFESNEAARAEVLSLIK